MVETLIIESAGKIVEKLKELVTYRQQRRRDFFQNILEPLFNDLMVMHTDYIKMFDDCWAQLLDNKISLQEIAESLRQRRVVYEGLRIKSRAILEALKGSDIDEVVRKFLISAANHIPDGELGPVNSTPSSFVLHKIYSSGGSLVDSPNESGNSPIGERQDVLNLVISTCNHIRTHWAWICEEYVRVKMWSLQ